MNVNRRQAYRAGAERCRRAGRVDPRLMLAIAVVLAGGIWGGYAWRNEGGEDGAGLRTETDPGDATESALEGDGSGGGLTSLAATRGEGAGESPLGGNAPGGQGDMPTALVRANGLPGGESIRMESAAARDEASKAAASVDWVEAGRAALGRGDSVTARDALSKALERPLSASDEQYARKELERLAGALVFSRALSAGDPLCGVHVIGEGDTLVGVAKANGVSTELLAKINRIADANVVYLGQRLKVVRGPFRAVVTKSRHRMDVYARDQFVKSYAVGLGADGGTPTGHWRVRNKLKNPEWTDPATSRLYLADDPMNPIGERWIGLACISSECAGRSGYGIHGTVDPRSIGRDESMGCVRLLAADVEEFYDLVVEGVSEVVIRP